MPIATLDPSEPASGTAVLDQYPDLEYFRVPDLPPAAYYVPDFITEDEEDFLLRKIGESPQPKWKTVGTGRRLQYWGGNMSKNGVLLPEAFPAWLTGFPNIVERIEGFLAAASTVPCQSFNQVLINEYQPEHGISPHKDGPAFRPLVATLSLGSHTVLDIHHYSSTVSPSPPMIASTTDDPTPRTIAASPLAHLLLLPRSLLILSSSLYSSHLHGIRAQTKDEVSIDGENGDKVANGDLIGQAEVVDKLRGGSWTGHREVRTSLTFRTAEKVLKGGAFSSQRGMARK